MNHGCVRVGKGEEDSVCVYVCVCVQIIVLPDAFQMTAEGGS